MGSHVAVAAALLVASLTSTALAQSDAVALVASGPEGVGAASAFESFVPIPPSHRFEAAPEETPSTIELLVTIDTAADLVRVWRRIDGVVLERRFEAGEEDAYGVALVASELLEVARTGGDPASVGAAVVVPSSAEATEPASEEPEAEPLETEALSEVDPVPAPEDPRDGLVVELTPGIGVEGWFSVDGDPWIVQPTLFFELLAGPANERWRVGGALFASALGGSPIDADGFEGAYARHDFGGRLSAGGDVGPIRTRLLGHARAGASAVVGDAEREGVNDDRRSATRAGWFIGLGFDLRQPLIEGLELFLEVAADLFPAPVRFTAFGETLVREPPLRLAGRFGVAWRFR